MDVSRWSFGDALRNALVSVGARNDHMHEPPLADLYSEYDSPELRVWAHAQAQALEQSQVVQVVRCQAALPLLGKRRDYSQEDLVAGKRQDCRLTHERYMYQ